MDASALQRDLNSLVLWASSNGLSLNLKKCDVMSFSGSNNQFMYNYVVRGISIARDDSVSDLARGGRSVRVMDLAEIVTN